VAGVAGNDRTPQLDCDAPSVDVVDQRKDVRDFLTSRRARITPSRPGCPFTAATAGWPVYVAKRWLC
jgi:hypothetical protein